MGKKVDKKLAMTRKVNSYIKEVTEYLKSMDQYESIDQATLENLRDAYILIIQCNEAIEEHGILFPNSQGVLKSNPAIKIKQDATIRFEKCLEILGIQNKQRYKDVEVIKEEEPTVLDQFIKGIK